MRRLQQCRPLERANNFAHGPAALSTLIDTITEIDIDLEWYKKRPTPSTSGPKLARKPSPQSSATRGTGGAKLARDEELLVLSHRCYYTVFYKMVTKAKRFGVTV